MHEDEAQKVFEVWKSEVVYKVKEYSPYQISEQLQQFAGLFSLGPFYYYILNFHDLSIEYAHHTTNDLLGIPSEDFSMQTLLSKLPKEELEELQLKEALTAHFLSNVISRDDLLDYKIVYFFRAYNAEGELRTFLHQATTIKQSNEGNIEHILGVQMDVSDFRVIKNNRVSFIGINGKPSYYNLDPLTDSVEFVPNEHASSPLQDLLTKRELEILKLLSKGLSSKVIADNLFLSFETVRTHRKNMLKKTGARTTAELISRCLVDGII